MRKYKKIVNPQGEFIAISIDRGYPNHPKCYTPITSFVGTTAWTWYEIPKHEYETYQAFGITEIDLYVRNDS